MSGPVLHKQGSTKKPHVGGLKWDETNLEQNERIKAELPPVKITEPKTPYHAPLEGDASGLDPLALDEPLAGQHHHVNDGERTSDFEASRRRHYMKEALAASRKMIEEELKEES